MSYLPAQVRISWKKPYEVDDITLIEVYKYRKELHRCDDYLDFAEKIYETDIIHDGECTDQINSPSSWSYAVFCKNAVSRTPCVTKTHIVYPDKDYDGIEDSVDEHLSDTDNDGIKNKCDADFIRNRFKKDTDGDGVINECDPDDDDDGILDAEDPFPWDYNRKLKVTIGDVVHEQEYPHGAIVGLIASPNVTDNEYFLGWAGEVSEANELITSVTMDKDQEVVASFGVKQFQLMIEQRDHPSNSAGTYGTVYGAGTKIYAKYTNVRAEPANGYKFKEWQGVALDSNRKYSSSMSFIMPEEDLTIYAIFEAD